MVKVLNPYGEQNPLGQALASVGQTLFADTLTPAMNREKMRLASASADEQTSKNKYTSTVADVFQQLGQDAYKDPRVMGAVNALNPDWGKIAEGNRLLTTTNPANAFEGETVARAMLGAGGSASSTPYYESRAQAETMRNNNIQSADRRYGTDQSIAQQRYEFDNKPVDAMVTTQAQGPVLPGQEMPSVTRPGFVRQSGAFEPGVSPIVKEGMTITTNPDGTTTVTQGGTAGLGKPTEISAKADLMGAAMIPGMDALSSAFGEGKGLSTSGAAVISALPNNALTTDILARAKMLDPQDQMTILGANAALNYMYQMTGAARTPSEEARALQNIPLASDPPEVKALKKNIWTSIAQGIAGQARDPRVKQQMTQVIDQMFAGQTPAYGLGSGAQPPAAQPAAPAPAPTGAPVTATGPNGEKLILKDGQWQPM